MDIPKSNQKADYVYKNTPQRDLSLTFLPPEETAADKAPVYFLIPGGGWCVEERQSMIDFSIQSVNDLRKKGFAVVAVDYRTSNEGANMHEIVCDCFDAARYVAHYADVLGVDAKELYVSGHSAGAHLALMLSYAPEEAYREENSLEDKFAVKAVAAMSAPTILYDRLEHNLSGELSSAFRGCDTAEERKKESPFTYASKDCPPTLLCAGTSDYLVSATASEHLMKELKDKGAVCEMILSVGGGHIFEKIHESVEPSVKMPEMQDAIRDYILHVASK